MTTPAEAPSDAQLIALTREGDMTAYDELYRRHYDDASRVARIVTNNSDEAQDVVSEAFTRVLTRLREGGGPETELTPYLRTVVRRLAIDRHRSSQRDGRPADPSILEILPRTDDPMARATDRQLVRQAFETLPDRWQQVLWHTEIEGRSPAAIAATLGSTPNAVAALAYRAREGLRQAYLAVNLSSDVRAECRPFAPKVAAYVRGTLSAQHTRAVTAHLGECQYCRERRDELLLLVSDLRGTLWPALLLPAAAGTAAVAGAAATGAAVAGSGAAVASGTGGGAAAPAAATAGAGAAAGGGASGGASSGSGSSALSTLSPGRLARMGGKTLAGTAGVVAAGIIAVGAYMMMNGSPDEPTGQAAPTTETHDPDTGSGPTDSDDAPPQPQDPGSPESTQDDETPEGPDTDTSDEQEPPDGDPIPVNDPDTDTPEDETPDDQTADDQPPDNETDEPEPGTPDPDEPPSPPVVENEPQDTTGRAGEPVTLAVDVTGNPAPSVVWQTRAPASSASASATPSGTATATPFASSAASSSTPMFDAMTGGGWADVPGATSSSLTVTPTAQDNGRRYRVVATNEHGSETTDPIVLTVQFPPQVTSGPENTTVNEGGATTFTASADANPAPSNVTWERRKAGQPWQNAGSGSMSQQGTRSTLELSGIDRDLNEYEYRAVFANEVGTANSNSAQLTVHWAPTVTSDPSDENRATGERAEFQASAEVGNPGRTKFRWEVDDGGGWQPIEGNDKWYDGTTAKWRVTVNSFDQNNSKYRAVFKNDAGTSKSSEATLKVHASGTMSISPGNGKDFCVQPDESSGAITLHSCSDPPIWEVTPADSGNGPNGYIIRWANGRCITASSSFDQDGVLPVVLSPCNSVISSYQLWHFVPDHTGKQTIHTESLVGIGIPKACLDVKSNKITYGTELIAYRCKDKDEDRENQLFRFEYSNS